MIVFQVFQDPQARLEDAEKQLALAKAEALASFSQFHVASHSGGVSLEGVSPTVTLPDDELERYLFEEALTSTATSTEKSETSTEQRRALSLDRWPLSPARPCSPKLGCQSKPNVARSD